MVKELSQTYKFTYLIGVDRKRNYDNNVYDKLQEYTANTSSIYFNINTTSQVDNFRQIVARARPVINTMHVLFVFRHDVYVKQEYTTGDVILHLLILFFSQVTSEKRGMLL